MSTTPQSLRVLGAASVETRLAPGKQRTRQYGFQVFQVSEYATNRELRQNPCTILKSMPEKLFMVYLNGAEDPMDLAYQQPVRASRVEVSEASLSFFKADGTLAAFFDKSAVHRWREVNESELQAN